MSGSVVCMHTHVCLAENRPAAEWRLAALSMAGTFGVGGAQPRPCPPRRRSRVSTSHLSDRYKAESSRMNLVGNRAEKGPGATAGGSSVVAGQRGREGPGGGGQ